MRIANPIYDVVFKYLLDDEKVAKLMLSALLGTEVLELEFRPTELEEKVQKPGGTDLLVLRLDFAVTVQLKEGGRKLVLIEIQKANNAGDLERFRRYVGSNYCNRKNSYEDERGRSKPLPLITIYFLGQGLENVDVPVLKINRHYQDAATGEDVPVTDPFVEALTHDSIVVQINRLNNRRRTELEQLLAVFDQGQSHGSSSHLLDILVENFPARYREVLRRLERASADQKVQDRMDLEDDLGRTFQDHVRDMADNRKVIDEQCTVIAEQCTVIAGLGASIEEKDRAIVEKDSLIADLRRRLENR